MEPHGLNDLVGNTVGLQTRDGDAGSTTLHAVWYDRGDPSDVPVAVVVENSQGDRRVIPWHAVDQIRLPKGAT